MSQFTRNQRIVVAAVFGHCNMGFPLPKVHEVRALLRAPSCTVNEAVMGLSYDYIESDMHQCWFEEEAYSWTKNPKTSSLDEIRKVAGWNNIANLITEALQ